MTRRQRAMALGIAGATALSVWGSIADAYAWKDVYSWQGHANQPVAMDKDDDGNVYLLATCINGNGNKDVVITKYSSSGDRGTTPWVYNSGGDDEAVDFVVDAANDRIYVVAYVNANYVTLAFDLTNPGGGVVSGWPKTYDNGGDDEPTAIAMKSDGSWVVVTGTSEAEATEYDYFTIVYSCAGTQMGSHRFDRGSTEADPPSDIATAVAVDASGYIYVTGTSNDGDDDDDNYDYVTLKYNSACTPQWANPAVGDFSEDDSPASIGVYDSYVYVTGTVEGPGNNGCDVMTVDYALISGTEGTHVGYHDENDLAAGMAVSFGGEIYVAVHTTVGGGYSASTVKYNSSLSEQWVKKEASGSYPSLGPAGISLDDMGNSYIAYTWARTGEDIAVRRYELNGDRLAWAPYNSGGSNTDQAHALVACIADDGTPWVAVAGSQPGIGGSDLVVLRYDESEWGEGWSEARPMPLRSTPTRPSGKTVKRGGWLALDPSTGLVYAAKGYKTEDFFVYDAVEDTWGVKADILPGLEGRLPEKGCRGISDGVNSIYMTKGNNTLGFWHYDIAANTWAPLTDVPEGPTRKKVKGGTDLVYATDDGVDYVYMLKGYKTEFWRYDPATGVWEARANAPIGIKEKWDKGSWLAYDGENTIYAHKAKYYSGTEHEFWKYDIPGDTWHTTRLKGMPLSGLHSGKVKNKRLFAPLSG